MYQFIELQASHVQHCVAMRQSGSYWVTMSQNNTKSIQQLYEISKIRTLC